MNFSWIMPDDQKFIKHPTVEINYGIPLQVTGDPEKANLFLCLFNPSVDEGEKKPDENTDLESYRRDIEDMWKIYNKEERFSGLVCNFKKNILQLSIGGTDEKNYYYEHYYASLGKVFGKEKIGIETLKNAPICNLELVPYREKSKRKLDKDKFIQESKTVKIVVKIIMKRIDDYLRNEDGIPPVFCIRNRKAYIEAINSYLKGGVIVGGQKISSFDELVSEIYKKKGVCLFYEITNQRGSLRNVAVMDGNKNFNKVIHAVFDGNLN